MYQTAVTS